jgi:uncharacterized protein (TIGR03083 family)
MDGLAASIANLEELLRSLDQAEWDKQSRCDGWTTGDVARHCVGSLVNALAGRTDGLGSPEVTQREVDERAGRSAAELADECAAVGRAVAEVAPMFDDDALWNAPAPGGYEGTFGDGVEALWADFWFHSDDIRAAIGQAPVADAGLPGAVSHVTFELGKRGWTGAVPATADAQVPWLLAATGRAPAVDGLLNIYA